MLAEQSDKEPPRLLQARNEYKARIKYVTDPIRRQYLVQLDSLKRELGRTGDAEGAVAIQNEIDRVTRESAARPDLTGAWSAYDGNRLTERPKLTANGEKLEFVHAGGNRDTLVFKDDTTVVSGRTGTKGEISPDAKKIKWANGSHWIRD